MANVLIKEDLIMLELGSSITGLHIDDALNLAISLLHAIKQQNAKLTKGVS